MQIIFSDEFKKDYKKIKDKSIRLSIAKQIKKLEILPECGKPLQYELKGHRTLRVPPFRIIYKIEKDKIVINCFDHRKEVYS
jgi:addiction module RelE/StbE family toxin